MMMTTAKCSIYNRNRGFTLIELALSLALIGLAVAALLVAFKIFIGDYAQVTTKKHVTTVAQAVENFILENGRFPCPAAIDLAVENPRYGQEADCATLRGYTAAGGAGPVVNVGEFAGGIWVERGAVEAAARVVRGMVPFHALNLPEQYANDGYGSRIFYVVSASQTQADSFMREGGAIAVVDSSATANGNAQSNHFVVFSAGANKNGAFNKYGIQVMPCGSGLDQENCNTGSTNREAIYMAARHSTAKGAGHFDDFVVNNATMQMPLWRLDDTNAFNMRAVDMANRVMVGDVTPADSPAEVRVDIGGDARTTMNTFGERYCLDDDPDRCFESELIAGQRAEMECRNGSYARAEGGNFMRGIARSEAACADDPVFSCPVGHFVTGMDENGQPQCSPYTFTPPPLPPLDDTCTSGFVWAVVESCSGHFADEPCPEGYTEAAVVSKYCGVAGQNGILTRRKCCPGTGTTAQCGPANGVESATAPTGDANLCSRGDASAVAADGTTGWRWTCTEGTATQNCAAPRPAAVCDSNYKPSIKIYMPWGTKTGLGEVSDNGVMSGDPCGQGGGARASHVTWNGETKAIDVECYMTAAQSCSYCQASKTENIGGVDFVISYQMEANGTASASVGCGIAPPPPPSVCDPAYKPNVRVCAPGKCRSGAGSASAGSSFGPGVDTCSIPGGAQATSTVTWNGETKSLSASCYPSDNGCRSTCTATDTQNVGGVDFTIEYELTINGGGGADVSTDAFGHVRCAGPPTDRPEVDGECGPGARADTMRPPATADQKCAAGTPSAVSPGPAPWTWTCAGLHGGDDATCSAGAMQQCDYPAGYPPGACQPHGGGWQCTQHGNTVELQCDEVMDPSGGDCTTFTAWCRDLSTGEPRQMQFSCPAHSGGPGHIVGSPDGPLDSCDNGQMIRRHCRTTGCYLQ